MISDFANSVVGDFLSVTPSCALVVKVFAISVTDWEVNLWAYAGSVGRGRQTVALVVEVGGIAFQIAYIFISPSIRSTNRRYVADTVEAFLKRARLTPAFKCPLNFVTAEVAVVYVVAPVDSANWLIHEITFAWCLTFIK